MGEFSISHLVIIAIILLVFFGPSRLPGLGQSLGKAIRGFKEGINDLNRDGSGDAGTHDPSTNKPARPSEQISTTGSAPEAKIRDAKPVDERDPTSRS